MKLKRFPIKSTFLVVLLVTLGVLGSGLLLAHSPDYQEHVAVKRAQDHLAARLGLPDAAVEVVGAERVVWSDSSLHSPVGSTEALPEGPVGEASAPLPGKSIIDEHPGHRIVLRVGEQAYVYRTAEQPYLPFLVFVKIRPSRAP